MYTTREALLAAWPMSSWWADLAGEGELDDARVDGAIADASADIDAELVRQYALPLQLSSPVTSALLRSRANVLAAYKLASSSAGRAVGQALRDAWEAAMRWLRDVGDGRVPLPGEIPTVMGPPSGAPVIAGDSTIMTRETMDGL
ncbi:MAG TPA: DUF1320 family protein [Phycisphaerae bacterium]|nr:DUF1320 family protein [Phycisphaerae bacterium]